MTIETLVGVFQWVGLTSAVLAALSTIIPWVLKRSERLAKFFNRRNWLIQDFELIAAVSTVLALVSFVGLWISTERLDEAKNRKIAELRDKTAGLTTLPDGRVLSGGALTGRPALLEERLEKLWKLYNTGKTDEGYMLALDCIRRYEESESVQPTVRMGDVYLVPQTVSQMYSVASHLAQKLNHHDNALTWAQKAVATHKTPFCSALLWSELMNAGQTNEAVVLCETIVTNGGPDAGTFLSLIGIGH